MDDVLQSDNSADDEDRLNWIAAAMASAAPSACAGVKSASRSAWASLSVSKAAAVIAQT